MSSKSLSGELMTWTAVALFDKRLRSVRLLKLGFVQLIRLPVNTFGFWIKKQPKVLRVSDSPINFLGRGNKIHIFTMFSLTIIAALIFLVMVMLYIHKAVQDEINKVKIQMLLKSIIELCREKYDFNELPSEERVHKAEGMIHHLEADWGLELDYD